MSQEKNKKDLILGIDSGGTKTHTILTDTKLNLLATSKNGPGNYHNIGEEKAKKNISSSISEALSKANMTEEDVDYAGFGIGGLDSEKDHNIVKSFLEEIDSVKNLKKKYIVNDVIISHYSITGGRPGIVVVGGTGSTIYGTGENGGSCRAGGWGWIIGDEGSGSYIAKRGLQEAGKAYDGRGKETLLVTLAKQHFGLDDFENIIPKMSEIKLPNDLARFAERVIDAASEGDEVALDVVEEGCEELAVGVNTVHKKLRFEESVRIGFVGGLTSSSFFTNKLEEKIQDRISNITFLKPVRYPVVGSIALVLEKIRKKPEIEKIRKLDSEIEEEN